jgi:hypothetical protein
VDVGGGCGIAAEGLEQQGGGEPAALEKGLADRGEPDVGRQLDVVEADDAELVRDADAERAGGLDDTEGLDVGGGEDGGRRVRVAEEVLGDGDGDLAGVGAVAVAIAWRKPISRSSALVKPRGSSGSPPMKAIRSCPRARRCSVAMRPPAMSSTTTELTGRVVLAASTSTTGTPASTMRARSSAGGGNDIRRRPSARSRRSRVPRKSSRWATDSMLKMTRSCWPPSRAAATPRSRSTGDGVVK